MTIDKPWLLSELSKASLILTVAAGIPYSFGEVADVLGPKAKHAVTLIALSVAALTKLLQWTIQAVTAFNPPESAPPVSATAQSSPLSGAGLTSNNPNP